MADIPFSFECPISLEIMVDPVSTVDGHTFERARIEQWLATHDTNPITNERLPSKALVPNRALRSTIDEWRVKYCKAVPRTAITLHEQVGEGSFKRVHRGELRLPGSRAATVVAVLQVRAGDVAAEAETLLRVAVHPHLVKFLGQCTDGGESLLLMEFAPLGDLRALLEEIEDTITPGHRLAMLQQVCGGMEALAAAKMIHRDMALRNVLVFVYEPENVAATSLKVSDFGLAVNAYTATAAYVQGGPRPVRWLAPEALERERYSEASDVWAFGVTAWELLTNGRRPYFAIPDDAAVITHVVGGGRLDPPAGGGELEAALWATVAPCFGSKAKERPTFAALSVALGHVQGSGATSGVEPSAALVKVQAAVKMVNAQPQGAAEVEVAKPRAAAEEAKVRAQAETAKAQVQVQAATAQVRAEAANPKAGAGGGEAAQAKIVVKAEVAWAQAQAEMVKPPTGGDCDARASALGDQAQFEAAAAVLAGAKWASPAVSAAVGQLEGPASRGHRDARTLLGECLYLGRGRCDDVGAARLLRLAADAGSIEGAFVLGKMMAVGSGKIRKDSAEAGRLCGPALPMLQKRADAGDAGAQRNLGWCYENGTGVEQDVAEAARLYHLAADQGEASAQTNLGWCYHNGVGVARDAAEAARLYRLAADQGNASAQYSLGWCYAHGTGVAKDVAEAVSLYRLAADQGNAVAQYSLGLCYDNGTGVAKDAAEAVSLYRLAANQGNAPAQYNLGWCCENGTGVAKCVAEAVRLYRLAANQGHATAQYNLGWCWENGSGVARDEVEAVRLYRLAADQSHARAQYNLGRCYKNGIGLTEDVAEAVRLYRLAADQGHARAQNSLGWCYENGTEVSCCCCFENGTGVAKDEAEAVRLYRLAADQGHARAQYNLGRCYAHGTGVAKDMAEAARLYRLAADQGDALAQHDLGRCHRNGTGVARDVAEAVRLYRLAADQGNVAARDKLRYMETNCTIL